MQQSPGSSPAAMASLQEQFRQEDGTFQRLCGEHITQADLEKLARERGAVLQELTIAPEYSDDPPEIDLTAVRFPRLRTLTLSQISLRGGFVLKKEKFPELRSLDAEHIHNNDRFELDLPKLEKLDLQFFPVGNAKDFGASLARSPQLKSLNGYKLWGLGCCPQFLQLPAAETVALYRSDDMHSLDIYAPKATHLNLQACFGIHRLRIHDRGFSSAKKVRQFATQASRCTGGPRHDKKLLNARIDSVIADLQADLPPAPATDDDEGGPKMTVNLLAANIDRVSCKLLKRHPRVGSERMEGLNDERSDVWGSCWDRSSDSEDSEDSDDYYDEDEDEDEDGDDEMDFES